MDSSSCFCCFLLFPLLLALQGDPVPSVKRFILCPWGCKPQAKENPAENSQMIVAYPVASLSIYTSPGFFYFQTSVT